MVSKTQAMCVRVFKFEHDGKKLESPYKCDPTDFSKKCKMYIKKNETDDDSRVFIEHQCSCALDGHNGFCGSMVGTPEYSDYLQEYRMYLANNKCHTFDRFNLKSYLDPCGSLINK